MKIKIMLDTSPLVRMPGVIVAEEKNTLVFESSAYVLDQLAVVVSDGKRETRQTVRNKAVDISDFTRSAGVLEIKVDLIKRGKVAKTWTFEPLVARELNGAFEIIPETAYLRQEITKLKQVIKEINTKINDIM